MERKPEWLRRPFISDQNQIFVEEVLKELNLNTVCREALCPNSHECFARKTATFMILGAACTRNCRFCNVSYAAPHPVNPQEPAHIAEAVARLGLRYAVITSVTRDDLAEGGAAHFAAVIHAIRLASPDTAIEVLIPDLQGSLSALHTIIMAAPAVISHNMETVSALYTAVRPQAEYYRSLELLTNIKKINPEIKSKTGIMLGLGETEAQVLSCMDDIRAANCDFLTIGQYLSPSKRHYPVHTYVHPDQFDKYKKIAEEKGFSFVASAPYVRSSYHAGEALGL